MRRMQHSTSLTEDQIAFVQELTQNNLISFSAAISKCIDIAMGRETPTEARYTPPQRSEKPTINFRALTPQVPPPPPPKPLVTWDTVCHPITKERSIILYEGVYYSTATRAPISIEEVQRIVDYANNQTS